ncbi:MAG: hypothetical protein HRU19_27100 [Pseudobacteriovorax sp.]|nr:hypothetical protein [Pseudobacteriovorax sp.]
MSTILSASVQSSSFTLERGVIRAATGTYVHKTVPLPGVPDYLTEPKVSAALIVEGGLDPSGSLEIGLFPTQKTFLFRSNDGRWLSVEAQKMNITTAYRYYINQSISFSLGILTSYSMGDGIVERESAQGIGLRDFDTEIALSPAIYMMDASAQLKVWQEGALAAFIDFRYSSRLKKQTKVSYDQYSIIGGFKYQLPKKDGS